MNYVSSPKILAGAMAYLAVFTGALLGYLVATRPVTPIRALLLCVPILIPFSLQLVRRPYLLVILAVALVGLDSRGVPLGGFQLSPSDFVIVWAGTLIILKGMAKADRLNHSGYFNSTFLLLILVLFWSLIGFGVNPDPYMQAKGIVSYIGNIAIYWIIISEITTKERVYFAVKAYIAGVIGVAILGIVQVVAWRLWGLSLGIIYFYRGIPFPRVTSTFLDPNIFGAYLTTGLLILVVMPFAGPKCNMIKSSLNLGAILIVAFGLLFSLSRAAWLSSLTVLFLGFWYISSRRFQGIGRVAFGLGLVVSAIVLLISIYPYLQSLYSIIEGINPNSISSRLQRWKDALTVAREYPVTGIGFGRFVEFRGGVIGEHNSYLSVLTSSGIVGLILYMSALLSPFCHALSVHANSHELEVARTALVLSLLALIIALFFISSANFKGIWVLAGLIDALNNICVVKREEFHGETSDF